MFELSNGLRIYPIEVEALILKMQNLMMSLCMEMNCKK